jgi:Flp pilus assembly protein TadG
VGKRAHDRGTVLMLMPAAVLVLLILGGISFDFAHLFLAKRELTSLAEAAANNAVTHGVDQAAVRRGDGYVLDPDLVVDSVVASVADHAPDLHFVGDARVELLSATEVRITITASIDYVFTRAVPGTPGAATVTVTATADARNAP